MHLCMHAEKIVNLDTPISAKQCNPRVSISIYQHVIYIGETNNLVYACKIQYCISKINMQILQ